MVKYPNLPLPTKGQFQSALPVALLKKRSGTSRWYYLHATFRFGFPRPGGVALEDNADIVADTPVAEEASIQ
jgi:hypothetical protein